VRVKRIIYAGESLVTSSRIADALLDYARRVVLARTSVAVHIPVLEDNGTVEEHTLLLGPATQIGSRGVTGLSAKEEGERFPAPAFPPLGDRPIEWDADWTN
jgi:hypothetical protein